MSLLIEPWLLAVMTIWQEARDQSFEGKCCVGEVIRERMRQKYMCDGTIEGTCLRPYQFSGWNTTDGNRLPSFRLYADDDVVENCIKAWERSESSGIVPEAVHYYNPDIVKVPPPWATLDKFIKKVGAHNFYRK